MSHGCNDFFDADLLARWTSRFVRYPSPQTELFEREPAVQGFIGECVTPLIEELGLPHRRDDMGNLTMCLGNGEGPHLLLMAYAMTHPAATMTSPYEGECVDREGEPSVRGRGVSEQKGALAAALAAMADFGRHDRIGGTVTLAVSTAGETGRHDAAESILEHLDEKPTAAVIVIGTSGRVSLGNKGRLDVLVHVEGQAAHSSTPWAGINALEGMRRVMNRLADAGIDPGDHPTLGKATLTPTFIESAPRATHTLQNRATLTLDRRLLPGQDPAEALAALRSVVGSEAPWGISVEPGPFMYPCELAEESGLVRAIDEGAGPQARFHSHGALDAGYFARHGIEATMWGPGDMEMWHTDEETIPVAEIVRGARGYRGLIGRYLAG